MEGVAADDGIATLTGVFGTNFLMLIYSILLAWSCVVSWEHGFFHEPKASGLRDCLWQVCLSEECVKSLKTLSAAKQADALATIKRLADGYLNSPWQADQKLAKDAKGTGMCLLRADCESGVFGWKPEIVVDIEQLKYLEVLEIWFFESDEASAKKAAAEVVKVWLESNRTTVV